MTEAIYVRAQGTDLEKAQPIYCSPCSNYLFKCSSFVHSKSMGFATFSCGLCCSSMLLASGMDLTYNMMWLRERS